MSAWSTRLQVFKNKYFLAGLMIKFVCLFFFGSEYLHQYFIPFIDQSLLHIGENPWSLSPPQQFPYGFFIFVCLFIPKSILYFIFGDASLGSSALSLFGMKLSLLFFDGLLFWTLSRWSGRAADKVVTFYWLNPIVFYITYVHGQLDIVSMSLCLLSFYFLFKDRIGWASAVFGLAVISKFHVILIAPFLAAFLWNRFFIRDAIKHLASAVAIVLSLVIVGFLPVILSSHFDYVTTGSPEAQRVFSAKILFDSENYIFIGLTLVFLVLGRLIFSTRITQKGLIYGSGLLLGVLLFITNPMPGWYLWVMPFLCLFYVHYPTTPKLLLGALTVFYFNYFLIAPLSPSIFYRNLSLTLLQTSLLSLLLSLYFIAVKRESPLRNRLKPLLIGLSGDSGAGKNHLSRLVQNLLGENNCFMIEGDSYHKWERGNKNWQSLTHLNPQANNLSKLHEHTENISKGLAIEHHHYDHTTGKFTQPHLFNPAKTIIIQGLHSLYLKGLRESLDFKIFLNPSERVRLYWKIRRDVNERGHPLENVLASFEKRRPDSRMHIQPQRSKSDWVIEIDCADDFDLKDITNWRTESLSAKNLELAVKYTLYNDENISELVESLRNLNMNVVFEFLEADMDRAVIKISGSMSEEQVTNTALSLFPELRSLTRNRLPPKFSSGLDGVHQLFFLALLKKRMA